MRVEIKQGRGETASVHGPGWTASVVPSGLWLSVWCGGMHVTISGSSVDELLGAWEAVRAKLGEGPLPQDLRDAYAACRRELDLRAASDQRPRSNLEVFAAGVGAGVDPDLAARAAGGTGRR